MSHPTRTIITVLMTLTPSVACGKAPDSPTPQEQIAEAGPDRTAEAAVETLAPTPVDLPVEFSADFPVIPESTIVAASATPATGGTLSEATLVVPRQRNVVVEWYRTSLPDSGWEITSHDSIGPVRILRATQGESSIELSIEPHPDAADSKWVRIRTSIWQIER
jgi:hypothetical protein